MAFHRVPFYVGGGPEGNPEHPADLVRQVMPLTGNGVEAPEHLQPRATSPISGQIIFASGGVILQGQAQEYQGPYSDFNTGDLFYTLPSNGTGAERYDMVVVRVEDPDFEGTRDRMLDSLIFLETITGVSSTAKTLVDAGKPGYTAAPLARVRRSATTDDFADADITDLRQLARPRTEYYQDSVQHGSTVQTVLEGAQTVWFPDSAEVFTDVPEWAVRMDIDVEIVGARAAFDAGGYSPHQIFGRAHIEVDGVVESGFTSWSIDYGTPVSHITLGHAYTEDAIPLRGKRVRVRPIINFNGGDGGVLEAHNGTVTKFRIFYRETPRAFNQ